MQEAYRRTKPRQLDKSSQADFSWLWFSQVLCYVTHNYIVVTCKPWCQLQLSVYTHVTKIKYNYYTMLNSLDLILARFCRSFFISLVVHKCRMAMAHAFLYHSAPRPEVLKHPSSAVIAFFRIVEAPIKRCHRILRRTIGGYYIR